MATKKPAAKPAAKKSASAVKSRGLTKPLSIKPKPVKQEPDVSEAYTPQFAGNSFMQRAQSTPL